MKRYIPIVASLMVFSLISCDEVMDLTQPEKAEVTYSILPCRFIRQANMIYIWMSRNTNITLWWRKAIAKKKQRRNWLLSMPKSLVKNITSYLWNIMIWMGVILILRGRCPAYGKFALP